MGLNKCCERELTRML